MKYQLHRECFRGVHDTEWQKYWYSLLNRAFTLPQPNIGVVCRGLVIHVHLEDHSGEEVIADSSEPITYVKLGTRAIQRLLEPTGVSDPYADGIADAKQVAERRELGYFAQSIEAHGKFAPEEDHLDQNSLPLADNVIDRDGTGELQGEEPNRGGANDPGTYVRSIGLATVHHSILAEDTDAPVKATDSDRTEAETLARAFLRACESYRIGIKNCDPERAVLGPTVWRFYVRLQRGQRLDQLRNALEDIGREMSRSGLLVGTIPDSQEVTLDIPRSEREVCHLDRVLTRIPRVTSPEQLPIAIGITPEGHDIIRDLGQMPHLLVGGTTGAGKTVFLYGILASLLVSHPNPDSLRLIISTSKPEDFTFFSGLPHLETGSVIADADEAIEMLERAIPETFESRLAILTEARCRDIVEFNRRHENKIPPLVVIIDEFADLADQLGGSKSRRNEFYTHIRRIAQLGRSRGVHLVLCTQRPSADLVPTNIRNLMNARVALRVNDSAASRMILDESGAEHLQFHGDMLFKEHASLTRAQSYFAQSADLEKVLRRLR